MVAPTPSTSSEMMTANGGLWSVCENIIRESEEVIPVNSEQLSLKEEVEKYQTSLRHFRLRFNQSTHQVITFPDVHVSADEDMPSSSRTFRVSSPTEALLDPESGSSYDDSEFSDDDEYLVTSAKKKIQQNLSNDESYLK
ncbi:hypothetical protein EVAR_91685_1 [Eumeta japonica]|uniref:Uncharacterized protein n=1 Tax=Eumeta variegata TaxID=151549 RepID=A0A4C1Z4J2_EUMVA|nr:hypothetical protein EVAR_91685_1 [Eumeta japonica]